MHLHHSLLGLALAGALEQMKAPPRSFHPGTRDTAPKLGPYKSNARPRRERRALWRSRIRESRQTKATMPWHASGLTMSGTHPRGS